MTKAELIKALEGVPDDAVVKLFDRLSMYDDLGMHPVTSVVYGEAVRINSTEVLLIADTP